MAKPPQQVLFCMVSCLLWYWSQWMTLDWTRSKLWPARPDLFQILRASQEAFRRCWCVTGKWQKMTSSRKTCMSLSACGGQKWFGSPTINSGEGSYMRHWLHRSLKEMKQLGSHSLCTFTLLIEAYWDPGLCMCKLTRAASSHAAQAALGYIALST